MSLFPRTKKRVKRSVDLSTDTDVALDRFRALAEKRGVSFSRGSAIDAVIGTVLNLKPNQASRLLAEAHEALSNAEDVLKGTRKDDEFAHQEASDEVKNWNSLVKLFDILADKDELPTPMRLIEMLGRKVLVPDTPDWVILNEEHAPESTVANIIEIKHGERFNAPHFIYFDNDETSTKAIDKMVLSAWPGYEEVLKRRIEPILDSRGRCINAKELMDAPNPGYYRATTYDPLLGNPYGVAIIPDESDEEEGSR